jgi:LPXTG-site transpeptidase (sortase) family protein
MEKDRRRTLDKKSRRLKRLFSLFCLALGLVLLGYVLLPLFWWQFSFAFGEFSQDEIISPVPDSTSIYPPQIRLPRESGFGLILLASSNVSSSPLSSSILKFDKKAFISEFTLSIPKLKIYDAKVKVDSEEFDSSLALFPGTALPGEENGNAFVSGHSSILSNPKDYKSIFSALPRLEEGDEVLVNIAGVEYRFLVESKRVVEPSDLSVVSPPQSGRYLTLMTCVPPGTRLKRLVVICKLAAEEGG